MKQCPWCGERIGFDAQLGVRPARYGPRWHTLTLIARARAVLVCPYCASPVKYSRSGRRWLLLTLPLLGYAVPAFISLRMNGHDQEVPGYLVGILLALAVFGVVMTARRQTLERTSDE